MAVRFLVGDRVTLTNTFKNAAGTPTDPTDVTLVVTKPDGTATTHDYNPGTIVRTGPGVFTQNVDVDQAGTWTYRWTGSGAVVDVEDGSFEVWPTAAVGTLDVVTLGEAKQALNHDIDDTDHDDELRQWVTAISRRFDELCGAVVLRTVTGEAHDGGRRLIHLRHAPTSKTSATTVTTVTEYDHTTATVLAAETNAAKPADAYLFDVETGLVYRRSSGADRRFVTGRRNVVVDYQAGRYTTTKAVDAKFKLAAATILRRFWAREAGAWARGGDPFTEGIGFFKAVDPIVGELLADEMRAFT